MKMVEYQSKAQNTLLILPSSKDFHVTCHGRREP
jgi:hypothetical protein